MSRPPGSRGPLALWVTGPGRVIAPFVAHSSHLASLTIEIQFVGARTDQTERLAGGAVWVANQGDDTVTRLALPDD